MFRLIRYNLRNQITRVSTYITPIIIFIIIMAIKAIMNVDSGLMNVFNNLGDEFFFMSRSFFVELAAFIGALVFVGMVINNIYKNPREDGSIMTIISKPMKRKDMILGNLLSLGICIVMFGLSLFALYGISTVLDSGTSADKILSTLSIFIGVIVIMLIFASIILLVGSFMSARSLITFSIVAGAFVPMISVVISLTAEPELQYANHYKYVDAQDFINNKDVEEMYLDMSKVVGERNQQQELASGKADLYKSLSFIDPWYQLSGLFNLFNKNTHTHINWEQSTIDNKATIQLGTKKYSMITEPMKSINLENDLHTISFNLANAQYVDAIKAQASRINSLSFERQLMVMNAMLEEGTLSSAKDKIETFVDDAIASTNKNAVIMFHELSATSLMLLEKLIDLNIITQSTHTTITPGMFYDSTNSNSYLIDSSDIPVFVKDDYINKTYLFIFWVAVALAFFGLTTIVEFKRDII